MLERYMLERCLSSLPGSLDGQADSAGLIKCILRSASLVAYKLVCLFSIFQEETELSGLLYPQTKMVTKMACYIVIHP